MNETMKLNEVQELVEGMMRVKDAIVTMTLEASKESLESVRETIAKQSAMLDESIKQTELVYELFERERKDRIICSEKYEILRDAIVYNELEDTILPLVESLRESEEEVGFPQYGKEAFDEVRDEVENYWPEIESITNDPVNIIGELKYEILRMIELGKEPVFTDFDVDKEVFHNAMEEIHNEGLATNITFSRQGRGNTILIAYANNSMLTDRGKEYIANNR